MRLSLSLHRDLLRLTVDDDAPGVPARRVPLDNERTGRGMAIVASLASGWGVEPRIPGKQVWVDLDVPAELTVDLPSCHWPTRFQLELPPDVITEIRRWPRSRPWPRSRRSPRCRQSDRSGSREPATASWTLRRPSDGRTQHIGRTRTCTPRSGTGATAR